MVLPNRLNFGALRHPALLLFVLLWVASGLSIALLGGMELFLARLPAVLGFWLFALLTILITQAPPPSWTHDRVEKRRTILQLIVIGAMILLTMLDGLAFHGIIATDFPLAIGSRIRPFFALFTNAITYFVIPFLLLLLLGARPSEIGFGRGHRVWQVIALWCALPLLFWLITLLNGTLTLPALLSELGNNAIQNGFFEEFLFRGALQTRLRKLMSPMSAVVTTALTFGLWHLGLGFSDAGSLPGAIAVCIFSQAAYGLAFGIIMERTRNLLAPSVIHVVTNSIG